MFCFYTNSSLLYTYCILTPFFFVLLVSVSLYRVPYSFLWLRSIPKHGYLHYVTSPLLMIMVLHYTLALYTCIWERFLHAELLDQKGIFHFDGAIVFSGGMNVPTSSVEEFHFHIFANSEWPNFGDFASQRYKKVFICGPDGVVVKAILCVGIACLDPQLELDGWSLWEFIWEKAPPHPHHRLPAYHSLSLTCQGQALTS